MHVRKNGTSGALSPPRCRDCHRPVLHVPKLRRDAAILKNVRFRLDPMLARDSHMMHVPRVAVPRVAVPRALPRVAVPRCRGLRCRETQNACRGSQCRGPCRGSQCRGAAGCGAAKRETPAAGRSAAGPRALGRGPWGWTRCPITSAPWLEPDHRKASKPCPLRRLLPPVASKWH
jgi:hypothetical protein